MAHKSDIKFDKLYQKMYNTKLWVMAYQNIAAKPGNMTPGVDGKTIDGFGMETIKELVAELKESKYKPNPVSRTYIPKSNGGKRPIGIPCFRDKLIQEVMKLILEAIYEPTFKDTSHGFRPNRSCHTALKQVKKMTGTRWWIEGDIKSFFDDINHDVLLEILGERITDKRFLHIINQFLKAGYVYHEEHIETFSGTPQGGIISPILANIYLDKLDKEMERIKKHFNQGKRRRIPREYRSTRHYKAKARRYAQETGDWEPYRELEKKQMQLPAGDPMDEGFKRLSYIRYADDFIVSIIGSKANAQEIEAEIREFLANKLKLTLSEEKTLITHAKAKAKFLGYEITRWRRTKKIRLEGSQHRSTSYKIALQIPDEKLVAYSLKYGDTVNWKGKHRGELINLSELEILMSFNDEIRGFVNFYQLADNYHIQTPKLLWIAQSSFFRTLAGKRKSTLNKVSRSMKVGPGNYQLEVMLENGERRKYRLATSTKVLPKTKISWEDDQIPNVMKYRGITELGQRLAANRCEWCGKTQGSFEVHHVRKLKDLKGKEAWEKNMIARRRKTMVMCQQCHHSLHKGTLEPKTST
jgi:group II intron reverse transcriptase/maturase